MTNLPPVQRLEVQCRAGVAECLQAYRKKHGLDGVDAFSHAMTALSVVDTAIMQGRKIGIVIGDELANHMSYWNVRVPRRIVPLDMTSLGMGLSDRIVVLLVHAVHDAYDIYSTYARVYRLSSEVVIARAVALLTLIDRGALAVKIDKKYHAVEASVLRSPSA